MLRKLSYLLATLFTSAMLLMPAVVLAENSVSNSSSSSSANTSKSSDSSTSSSINSDNSTSATDSEQAVEIENQNHNMADRISKLKTAFKVKLGLAEIARIKLRCVAAQSTVGTLNTKFGNSVSVRTKAYTELQAKLDQLVTKLKAKNVDTTTLEQQITALKAKITTYTSDLTAYKQSLADLKTVSCKTDPDGFQAALLAARSAHAKLVTDVLAVRTYLVGTIKPTLEGIKTALGDSAKSSDTTSDTSNTNSGSSN